MKKIIIEVFGLFVFVAGISFFLYRNNLPKEVKKFLNVGDKLDIINIGTSHGNAFNYSISPLKGESFVKAGNTPYYDLQNYLYLKKYLNKGAILVIPVSYFAFGADENRSDLGANNSFVDDFYFYLPKEQIFSYSKEKAKGLVLFNIQEGFKNLFRLKKNNQETNFGIYENNLLEHSKFIAKQHKKLGELSPPNRNIDYLSIIILDAQQAGFYPILVSVPYFYTYNREIGVDWLNINYYNHVDEIRNKLNIAYLDYSHDTRFCNEPTFFSNSDHLSDIGKISFSKVFLKDLTNLKKY